MSTPSVSVWLHDGSLVTVNLPEGDARCEFLRWPFRRHGRLDIYVDDCIVAHLTRVTGWRYNP